MEMRACYLFCAAIGPLVVICLAVLFYEIAAPRWVLSVSLALPAILSQTLVVACSSQFPFELLVSPACARCSVRGLTNVSIEPESWTQSQTGYSVLQVAVTRCLQHQARATFWTNQTVSITQEAKKWLSVSCTSLKLTPVNMCISQG